MGRFSGAYGETIELVVGTEVLKVDDALGMGVTKAKTAPLGVETLDERRSWDKDLMQVTENPAVSLPLKGSLSSDPFVYSPINCYSRESMDE